MNTNSEEKEEQSITPPVVNINDMLKIFATNEISNIESLKLINWGSCIQKVHKIWSNAWFTLPKGSFYLDCGQSFATKISPLVCKSISRFVESSLLSEFYFTNFKLYSSQLNLLLNAWKYLITVEIFDNQMIDKDKIRLSQIEYCESDAKENKRSNPITFK